jgi:hypothetical protein
VDATAAPREITKLKTFLQIGVARDPLFRSTLTKDLDLSSYFAQNRLPSRNMSGIPRPDGPDVNIGKFNLYLTTPTTHFVRCSNDEDHLGFIWDHPCGRFFEIIYSVKGDTPVDSYLYRW